jgi:uroporphyrin-III C-methyltransferase/precorrin-2 dehydrogenase/sirohydrochlorin ferrochelatase
MDHLPVFLNVTNAPCLVVGGGEVAARKASLLLRAGARVTVIAPTMVPGLVELVESGRVTHEARVFSPRDDDLTGYRLVLVAIDVGTLNEAVSDAARRQGVPVNVADRPDLCDFVLPAVVDRSPVVVAVSSGGASPVLARLLRSRLETLIPAGYGRLAALVGRLRATVKKRLTDPLARRRYWEAMLQGPAAELVFAGREDAALELMERALQQAETLVPGMGEVYLVGAGPGDPDLLTFRALRLMQQADVVLYDRLVDTRILDLVRREAERLYVGKKRAYHTVRQEEINGVMVRLAKEHKRVLRLKGGDPFIFGRGGEEIATLAEEGIPFQVVPGITAASGCASYAGIPLTHREYAQSVVFVTGHSKDGSTLDLNWSALIQPRQTLVVYMGLLGLEALCQALMEHGQSADTPAALVEHGTLASQRVLVGTVATLPQQVAQMDVHAPTLVIVGDVVRLHDKLAWFKTE